MRKMGLAILMATCLTATSWAQTKDASKPADASKAKPADSKPGAPQLPKPAAELKQLAYFAGNWTSTGTLQPGDFGPGGKFTNKEHNEWFPGGFFLVGHVESSGAMGPLKEAAIFGYDTEHKVYTYHAINSIGQVETATGTVISGDWTWNSEMTVNGKKMKTRFLVHEDSPTSYTMKFDSSTDNGKTWKTMMDGKATKSAAAAK